MRSSLGEILERAAHWPEDARRELENLAQDIEAELGKGTYKATPAELAGIDRGLKDSADGKFASADRVENALGKLHR